MRVLIYGAGVLGSMLAVRLHAAGHDVNLLARGERLADLRKHGIVLENTQNQVRTTARVPLVDALAPDDDYDLVVVVMRKNQVADVLPVLAANERIPSILFIGNNAAGPDILVEAVGRDRVLAGFALAGGEREDHVVRYVISGNNIRLVMGELHGRVTPRLRQVMQVFTDGGLTVEASPNIDAWLKTHVALVSPIANAIYAAGGDLKRVARTRDILVLTVRAVREGLRVVRAAGLPVLPASIALLEWLPEPVLVFGLGRMAQTQQAEIAAAAHANAARDEMSLLAAEFQALAATTTVPTPAIEALARYIDPDEPPVPEYAATLPIKWQGLIATVMAVMVVSNIVVNALVFVAGLFRGRQQQD